MISLHTSTRTPMSTGPGPCAMPCSRHMRSNQSAPRRPVATTVCRARSSLAPSGPSRATPTHVPSWMSTCVQVVEKRSSTPDATRCSSMRAYRSRARSVPRWRRGQSTSLRPALMARRRMSAGGKRELAVGKRPRAREPRREAARLAAHARARGPAQLFGTTALAHRQPLVHHDDVPRMSMFEQRQRAEYARRPHADDDDVRITCAHERPPLSCCLVASRASCAERCTRDGAGAAAQAPVPPL